MASASSSISTGANLTTPTIPSWIVNRLAHRDLNQGPIANSFLHPAHDATPQAKAILVQADRVADGLGLDDGLLDGLVDGLNLLGPRRVLSIPAAPTC